MCEANAYIRSGSKKEMVIEEVNKIIPEGDLLVIEGILESESL